MTKRLLHEEAGLDVWLDKENRWLYADWKERHTDESVRDGMDLLIGLINEHQIGKVLNDNTRMSGIWVNMASWLATDALQRARQAGMKSFAHVLASSYAARVSAEAAFYLLGPNDSDIKTFRDMESAMNWLRNRN